MGYHHREVAKTRRASPKILPGGDKPALNPTSQRTDGRAGLDIHCCRRWLGVAYGWHFVDSQHMRPSRQPGAIAVTLCDVRHRSAIDLKVESKIPSEVRYPVHGQVARREVMIRPEVPEWTTLRNSADENCAPKNHHQKNIPCEAVF